MLFVVLLVVRCGFRRNWLHLRGLYLFNMPRVLCRTSKVPVYDCCWFKPHLLLVVRKLWRSFYPCNNYVNYPSQFANVGWYLWYLLYQLYTQKVVALHCILYHQQYNGSIVIAVWQFTAADACSRDCPSSKYGMYVAVHMLEASSGGMCRCEYVSISLDLVGGTFVLLLDFIFKI